MFDLPESVRRYYHDKRVQAATDLLLGDKIAFEPSDWTTVSQFYDACLAATQVQVEYAKTVLRLWELTWGAQPLDARWRAVPPDIKDEDTTIDPAGRWKASAFLRQYCAVHDDGLMLEIWVCLGAFQRKSNDLSLGLGVWRNQEPIVTGGLQGWVFDDDDDTLRFRPEIPENNGRYDLAPFVDQAAKATVLINGQL